MAQKLTKVAEATTLANTDTLIVVDESAQNTDGSTGALKRIPKSNTGFALPSDITSAINTEVSNRNTAITNAINTEVSNRNTAISNAIDTEVDNRNDAIDEALSEYAKVDGYYEEMAVGSAEQLLSTQFVEDSVPYKFRTSGGSKDIGNREYDEIVGGSIVWNQLFQAYTGTVTMEGTTLVGSSNGEWTITGTLNNRSSRFGIQPTNNVKGHIYYMCGNTKPTDPLYMSSQSFGVDGNGKGTIIKNTATNSGWYYVFSVRDTAEIGSAVNMIAHPQVVDLTAMFGSQVADYIYSLEQAEAGKGVAFFKSLFPNDYYPYNAGELMSVEGLQSHDTVGFNALEKTNLKQVNNTTVQTLNHIKVVGGKSYEFCFGKSIPNFSQITIKAYDSNDNQIDYFYAYYNTVVIGAMPSNAEYVILETYRNSGVTVAEMQNADPCFHLVWSGYRNGEYEEFKKHSYPLDSSLTLRGMLKLSAQNELYFDGDIYSHDGKVQRRYTEDNDAGSWDWGLTTWNGTPAFYVRTASPTFNIAGASMIANLFLPGYETISGDAFWTRKDDTKIIACPANNQIMIRDTSYSTAEELKAALSGKHFVYEKYTPTEETAEPYTSPQAVDDFGTEEYISGNVVPVGHNTQYPANLRDKLQHLPNLADNDGYYMISQQNKQMSLELFRIPKAPTTDGTYTLKATVSGGTPTYTWEAVE